MQAAGLPLEGHVLANALAGSVAHDPAASPAGRRRVLREYANIAAANVADPVPAPGAPTVFVGRDHALEMLMARRSTDAVAGAVTVRDNDLYLEPRPREPAQVAFDTNAAVASLTLRPYLDEPLAECRGTASRAAVVVEGDGRELYRAALAPRALRLATLDLRGVRRLTVRAEATGDARACHRVQLRVAQLLCYSARCNRPGPGLPEGMHVAESRILDDDPIEEDLLELEGMARADRPPATRAHTP